MKAADSVELFRDATIVGLAASFYFLGAVTNLSTTSVSWMILGALLAIGLCLLRGQASGLGRIIDQLDELKDELEKLKDELEELNSTQSLRDLQ